jgi:hypothetical protein
VEISTVPISLLKFSESHATHGNHQAALRGLVSQVCAYLSGKPCKLNFALFDVRLNYDKEDDIQPDLSIICGWRSRCCCRASPFEVRLNPATVLLPDLTVIGDPDKVDDKGFSGIPDLVIELLQRHELCKDPESKLYLRNSVLSTELLSLRSC